MCNVQYAVSSVQFVALEVFISVVWREIRNPFVTSASWLKMSYALYTFHFTFTDAFLSAKYDVILKVLIG